MAEWKKIIVSGSDAELNSFTSTGGNQVIQTSPALTKLSGSFSGSFTGDGSTLTGVQATGLDIDNFGNDLTGITIADTDKLALSDAGTEGRVNASQLATYVFNKASDAGDATIGSDGGITINASSVEGTMLNSNVADGSTTTLSSNTLSVLKVPNALTAGSGLSNGGGTFDGSSARTFSVDSGSLLPYYSGSIFSRISGDILINSATGVASIQANSVVLGTDTTGNYVATITAGTGIDTTGATTGEGIAHSISVDVSDFMTNGADNRVITATGTDAMNAETNLTFDGSTLGVTGAITTTGNVTVGGDLVVQGDVTQVQTTNLLVEDSFVLLRSGSAAVGDSGIIFGGSEGTANSGTALVWDGSYNSNDGRAAIANTVASADTSVTPSYYLAGVFEGTEANAATAQADHVGNIRVESGEIYIYV